MLAQLTYETGFGPHKMPIIEAFFEDRRIPRIHLNNLRSVVRANGIETLARALQDAEDQIDWCAFMETQHSSSEPCPA